MKAQRDETLIYSDQIDEMQSTLHVRTGDSLNFLAMTAAFKAVVIEGIEVVFMVVTVGRMSGALVPADLGATTAGMAVVALGLAIHRPLTRVPENALKFGVGVVIVSFGIFWLGELGLAWPGGDLAVAAIIAGVFTLAHLCVAIYRLQRRRIRSDALSMPRAGVVRSSSHQF
jgi:Ca2+/H+ antiporter, TMEM165/GDT1 family